MRDKLLSDKTAVFTSRHPDARRRLLARWPSRVGLKPAERVVDGDPVNPLRRGRPARGAASTSGRRSTTAARRSCTSPATCRPPGRDGLGQAQLDEIVELVDAAEGRTLGLFSLTARGGDGAAEASAPRLPHLTTLAQGDAQLPELARQFVEDPHTCLFGTL